jgi:hypothetical protein
MANPHEPVGRLTGSAPSSWHVARGTESRDDSQLMGDHRQHEPARRPASSGSSERRVLLLKFESSASAEDSPQSQRLNR